jgi:predicted DNA-binding protein (MmcQ/YjbR family)
MSFTRPVFQRLRTLCMRLPEAEEVTAWGHPAFRVRKKAFVAFEHVQKRPSVAFRLDREIVETLVATDGFFATPYGRGLWASAWADRTLSTKQLNSLALAAYRGVAGARLSALLANSVADNHPTDRVRRTRRST